MKRWLGDSVIPQAHPVRLVVRRRGTEVVEAGTLEQPELPDGLVHVRRVEHADLGEPCDAASGHPITVRGQPVTVREQRRAAGYAAWERRAERPMLVLALVFLVVLVVPMVADLPPAERTAFTVADVAIWAAFAVDYVARLYLAPARWRFVRSHLLDLLVLVVPFLRPLRALRLLRIARLGVVAGVAHSRAQRSLHATVAVYVTTAAAGLLVLAAAAMYDVERRAPSGNIAAYGYTDTSPRSYEEDHLISLELGGASSDQRNLWPEPGTSPNPKDKVENELHRRVCAGSMPLAEAQQRIATDWTTAAG